MFTAVTYAPTMLILSQTDLPPRNRAGSWLAERHPRGAGLGRSQLLRVIDAALDPLLLVFAHLAQRPAVMVSMNPQGDALAESITEFNYAILRRTSLDEFPQFVSVLQSLMRLCVNLNSKKFKVCRSVFL